MAGRVKVGCRNHIELRHQEHDLPSDQWTRTEASEKMLDWVHLELDRQRTQTRLAGAISSLFSVAAVEDHLPTRLGGRDVL
jgi:hypothetical protein